MVSIDQNQVKSFWDWFTSISDELGFNLEQEELLKALDRWVRSFGDLTWEVGPGIVEPNALVFSPNGQKELLSVTREIVARAPSYRGWEFHSAKPPKHWKLQFSLEDERGEPVHIDANGWQYALLKFPDGTFDIVVCIQNLPRDEVFRRRAAEIAIEGQVGELVMMAHIQNVQVVREFEGDLAGKGNSIKVLADHLASLVNIHG